MKKQVKHWLIPCAAAAFTIGASMISFAATGWNQEGDNWFYYDNGGSRVTQEWKKSGSTWFYLDENGQMAKSSLVEEDGNYYYVNSVGARVANEWREVPNDDDFGGDDAPETCWYYFGSTGKAYKGSGSGKASFKTITKANGDVKKYAFDDQGRMLFGWVDEAGEIQTGEDAWKSGIYYCGEAGDGARLESEWKKLDAADDENSDADFDDMYWFYFDTNGKKLMDTEKTINKGRYLFDENGAAQYSWNEKNVGTPSDAFYNLPDQCWVSTGWFKTVPSAEMNAEAHDNGEESWFYYSTEKKDLVRGQIKTINNYSYGFDENGEMLHGLYKLKVENKMIKEAVKIESESELPSKDEDWDVYYFGDSPKEGSMSIGNATVTLDGEKYSYTFKKSGTDRGAGAEGIYEDAIYVKGRMFKAEKELRYQVVEFEDNPYLINTSGKIQKNKKNVKDSDGNYYSTNAKGIVEYQGSEKE